MAEWSALKPDEGTRPKTFEEYVGSATGGAPSIGYDYSKMSIAAFMVLSIAGIAFATAIVVLLLFSILLFIAVYSAFVTLFIASYLKVRAAGRATPYSYTLVFSAPLAIDMVVSLVVPFAFLGIVSGFVGIFIAYWLLSDRNMV